MSRNGKADQPKRRRWRGEAVSEMRKLLDRSQVLDGARVEDASDGGAASFDGKRTRGNTGVETGEWEV